MAFELVAYHDGDVGRSQAFEPAREFILNGGPSICFPVLEPNHLVTGPVAGSEPVFANAIEVWTAVAPDETRGVIGRVTLYGFFTYYSFVIACPWPEEAIATYYVVDPTDPHTRVPSDLRRGECVPLPSAWKQRRRATQDEIEQLCNHATRAAETHMKGLPKPVASKPLPDSNELLARVLAEYRRRKE
jgi:hypothetical protein